MNTENTNSEHLNEVEKDIADRLDMPVEQVDANVQEIAELVGDTPEHVAEVVDENIAEAQEDGDFED